jgi:diacylglycerol kinase (ATP)
LGILTENLVALLTVAAGVGGDARLFYDLSASAKLKFGMNAYYAMAWRLWWNRKDGFVATCDRGLEKSGVTQLLAVRIREFGGVLGELAPGASLERETLRLLICETDSRRSYLAYILRTILRASWRVTGITLSDSREVDCDYPRGVCDPQGKVYVEADGELLGTLPAKIALISDALTLLMP